MEDNKEHEGIDLVDITEKIKTKKMAKRFELWVKDK